MAGDFKSGNKIQNKNIFVLAVLILALVMRLIFLGNMSLTVDEAVSVYISSRPVGEILPFMMKIGEVHPPLYFWLTGLWISVWTWLESLIPSFEAFLRFPSAIPGTLTVYLTFLVGRKLFNFKCGIAASFLMAISTFHIYFSREMRMYPMLLLLMLGSLYFYILLLEKPGFRNASGYVVFTVGALLTHYFALYAFCIEAAFTGYIFYLSQGRKDNKQTENSGAENGERGHGGFERTIAHLTENKDSFRKSVKWVAGSALIAVVSCAWWVPYFIRQTGFQEFSLRINPTVSSFFQLFSRLSYGENLIHPKVLNVDLFTVASIIPLFLVSWIIYKNRRKGSIFVEFYLWIPIILTFLVTFTRFHIFEYKYFFVITPALWILAAVSILSLGGKWSAKMLIFFFICLNLYTSLNYFTNPYYQGQDFKSAAAVVQKLVKPEQKVIVHPSMMSLPFIFYFGQNDQVSPMDFPDRERIEEISSRSVGAWLVTTVHHPMVKKAGLLYYLKKHYQAYPVARFTNYNPSNVIAIYYFRFSQKGTQNRKKKTN